MAQIRIKFSGRVLPDQNPDYWLALFPDGKPVIDGCAFYFDPDFGDYDWLVVYEDLMYPTSRLISSRIEPLACHRENTLIMLQEPASIKIYGAQFLSQYGHVLSFQTPDTINHPNHIWQVTPVRWFYGRPLGENDHDYVSVDALRSRKYVDKNRSISTVCSNKKMTPTLKARYDFTEFLDNNLGAEFDWFGRGIRPVNEKSQAMDPYKYHVAIENEIAPHYWTEKLADSFLANCLPFYYGPQNIGDYFHPDCLIAIDIKKPDEALEIIRKTLKDQLYETRLPAIKAAREQVLTDYNVMNMAAKIVRDRHQSNLTTPKGEKIMGRHAFRKNHPILASQDFAQRASFRVKNRLKHHSG